ncbi:MAG: hypothetical protein UW68_C0017G0026 [Candidatus Collierbacteria bacterium GW2011_GWB1_44_6]|uniref:Uncharacterized protein n=2 Tax=Candidatus Collieribacteriota TaxID=1752725 RepID=A0A0G1JNL6_9BACT|nr:MAG: hypothetical protein UV68_C0016G0008 [Candidatus Collierbacteria bacterium GW2011_GWC2_43_12]KKT73091.1 MAG: hypothetical protein UW68_C0017G0026 [Candidatus Collierbacteria bacterium GW2011_GWB1_44_6]
MEKNIQRLSGRDVRSKVSGLIERRGYLRDDGAHAFSREEALGITREFEQLAEQTGVSVAALEFLHNPVGLVGRGASNLTRGENVLEDLNVQWAQELKSAGLLE